MTRRALLLSGSPRTASTSQVVGEYLLEELAKLGWETGLQRIYSSIKSEEAWTILAGEAADADLLILSAPLYVDSFPSGVIRMMERLAMDRRLRSGGQSQRLIAIVNSGFPEPVQIQTVMEIAKRFARETGLIWAGGISLGSGGAINGRPLEEFGKMVHHIKLGLTEVAQALESDLEIPEEARDLSIRYPMPKRLLARIVNIMWWFQARPHETHKRLREQPYKIIDNG